MVGEPLQSLRGRGATSRRSETRRNETRRDARDRQADETGNWKGKRENRKSGYIKQRGSPQRSSGTVDKADTPAANGNSPCAVVHDCTRRQERATRDALDEERARRRPAGVLGVPPRVGQSRPVTQARFDVDFTLTFFGFCWVFCVPASHWPAPHVQRDSFSCRVLSRSFLSALPFLLLLPSDAAIGCQQSISRLSWAKPSSRRSLLLSRGSVIKRPACLVEIACSQSVSQSVSPSGSRSLRLL